MLQHPCTSTLKYTIEDAVLVSLIGGPVKRNTGPDGGVKKKAFDFSE